MATGKKWNKVALKEQFLIGVKDGSFKSVEDFWEKILKPMGMPHGTYNSLIHREKFRELMRPILGERAYEQRLSEAAQARSAVTRDYEKATMLSGRILDRVESDMNAGGELSAKEKVDIIRTLEVAQRISALALEKPTTIVDGAPTILVKISREASPYRPVNGGTGLKVPRLDAPDNRPSGEASGGVRGEKDTQDRPAVEIRPAQDPAIPVPGGGVVCGPVSDTGETGGMAEDAGHTPEAEGEADRGTDE